MTREYMRDILFAYLDALGGIDPDIDVDSITEDYLSELEEEGCFDTYAQEE
jgi:hypothetical protein